MDDWIFAIPTGAGPSYTWVVPFRNKSGEPLKGCRNGPCKKIAIKCLPITGTGAPINMMLFMFFITQNAQKYPLTCYIILFPSQHQSLRGFLDLYIPESRTKASFTCILGGGNSHPKRCYMSGFSNLLQDGPRIQLKME